MPIRSPVWRHCLKSFCQSIRNFLPFPPPLIFHFLKNHALSSVTSIFHWLSWNLHWNSMLVCFFDITKRWKRKIVANNIQINVEVDWLFFCVSRSFLDIRKGNKACLLAHYSKYFPLNFSIWFLKLLILHRSFFFLFYFCKMSPDSTF